MCALALCAIATTHASEEERAQQSFAQVWGKGAFDFTAAFTAGAASAVVGQKIIQAAYVHRAALALAAPTIAYPATMLTGYGVFVTLDKTGELVGITPYDEEKQPASGYPYHQEARYAVRSAGFLAGYYVASLYATPAFGKFMDDIMSLKNPLAKKE